MTASSSVVSPAVERSILRSIAEFQSDTAEILVARPPLAARMTLYVLAGMIVSAIALATLVPIERVVTARGRITSVAPHMVVQPLETSIIRRINVREGQLVRKGEILATLDPTFTGADVSLLGQRIESLEAELARLGAELTGKPYQPDGDGLSGRLQARIHDMRRGQLAASLSSFDQKIAATESSLERARRELAYYGERLRLIREIEGMRTTLEAKQAGSRLQTIVASDARVDIERNVAVQEANLATAKHELAFLRSERETFEKKWSAAIVEQMVDKQRQLDTAREEMAKAGRRKELVELRAAEDAVVLQVGDISIGSVAEVAKRMFVLVPVAGGLQAEVEVAARDQGFVKAGQRVELKLDAWPYTQHGTVEGGVRTVSGDSFVQKTAAGGSGPAVYLAHVDLKTPNLRDVPADFRLVPGMPITADVSVGSRTLFAYLLDKAAPLLLEGLREP